MPEVNATGESSRLRRTAALTISMGLLLLAALVNRKFNCPFLRTPVWDVLRGCDLLTLFALSPIGIAIMWDYMNSNSVSAKARRWLGLVFVLGVFLLGMAFGMHEPTNAMQIAGQGKVQAVHDSLAFFDDGLGHWTFFAGMMVVILALAAAETSNPFERPVPRWLGSASIAAGIAGAVSLFGNMINEKTGADMAVVLASLAIMAAIHWRNGFPSLSRLPMTLCLYLCLSLGAAATYGVWLFKALAA